MQSWQLPDNIADVLPTSARRLETTKESLLGLFRSYGYELVVPPLMQYSESLLVDIDPGLSIKTIRAVDQLTGLQMGLRADITPQISRIDAHLLAERKGVNRLCYAAPVLSAVPASMVSSREPLQMGAELYGLESAEGDVELIELMFRCLSLLGAGDAMLSLGHVGVFQALAQNAGLDRAGCEELVARIQTKDKPDVEAACRKRRLDAETTEAMISLCDLCGGDDTLERARRELPNLQAVGLALDLLEGVRERFADKPCHIDLGELRMDQYHTGLLFSAYGSAWSGSVMRGGRYNGLGKYFGRSRYATGFSFDLKDFLDMIPENRQSRAILVDRRDLPKARELMDKLRAQGESVIADYLSEGPESLGCDRKIVWDESARAYAVRPVEAEGRAR